MKFTILFDVRMTSFLSGRGTGFCGIFEGMLRSCRCLLLLGWVMLASCTSLPASTMPRTPTAVTGTATPTVLWFPPTRTPTPFVVPTPTPATLPMRGEEIFRDDFSRPELWTMSTLPSARVALERNRLILSLDGRRLYLMTLRAGPTLSDFYLQVKARLNLCRQNDAYGALFRAASGGDYYRYILNCQGKLRLERVQGGQVIALQEWLESGEVPRGAPGEVTLGIWALGTEMRFFLNDRFQFALRDPLFRAGQVGLFALAAGDTPLVIAFSDLAVYAALPSPLAGTASPAP